MAVVSVCSLPLRPKSNALSVGEIYGGDCKNQVGDLPGIFARDVEKAYKY